MIIIKLIKNPRVTEKSAIQAEGNVYAFDVLKSANKTEIKKAVFDLYKVKATKVNILTVKDKAVFARGKKGVKRGGKKALVYLKKGDKIEFV